MASKIELPYVLRLARTVEEWKRIDTTGLTEDDASTLTVYTGLADGLEINVAKLVTDVDYGIDELDTSIEHYGIFGRSTSNPADVFEYSGQRGMRKLYRYIERDPKRNRIPYNEHD
ncbi:MAG TPA: hypothetical protein VJB06_02075 [archaeon]|nr:hypothetical protein [archaeon]